MENKFNFGSFLIGMFVVILLLLPTVIKLSNAQKERTLKEAVTETQAPEPSLEETLRTINDTINDVHITEYGHYRCIMILNPGKDDPNEVLIYLQDRKKSVTVPIHTHVDEHNTWDSLKVHSKEFMQRSITLMFE